jgi:hypothetical protein
MKGMIGSFGTIGWPASNRIVLPLAGAVSFS